MKKLLLTIMVSAVMAFGASAGQLTKMTSKTSAAQAAGMRASSALNLTNAVVGICDQSNTLAEYYIMLASTADAQYDKNQGTVSMQNGYLLVLDMYNSITSPAQLPAGIYSPTTEASGYSTFTFDSEYSFLQYYQKGKVVSEAFISGAVTVTVDNNGYYELSCAVDVSGASREIRYSGRIPLTVTGEKESVYPQMKRDVEIDMKYGGIAFYQGITDYSNNGVTYINLYSAPFDSNGALQADGFNLAMMVAHKRVITKDKFQLFPGTYTNAYTLDRFTWYPCREMNYSFDGSVITTQFGSFIRELKSNTADRYTYGYLASGEFVLEEVGDGVYKGYLDAVTDLGYTVKVNFEGPIELNTDNAAVGSAPLSWLEDDVELDFSKLDKGRVFHRGIMGGCRDLTVDLGSPAGRDEAINYGGDLLRLEFLCPQTHFVLQPGVYNVISRRWNDYELAAGGTYEPMSLNQYRWGGSSGGDLDGTRYCHFEEGRYCVYDLWGPVIEGQVRVETEDFVDYHMDIELYDDASFMITGTWDGPLELMYDAEALAAGVSMVDVDGLKVVVEPGMIMVAGGKTEPLELYSTSGALVATDTAGQGIATGQLAPGVYILKVNGQTVKVAI